jgi:hypothetical protein
MENAPVGLGFLVISGQKRGEKHLPEIMWGIYVLSFRFKETICPPHI